MNWYVYRFVKATPEQQKPFITKADLMLNKNKELQTTKQKVLKLIQSEFNLTPSPSPKRERSEKEALKFSPKLQKLQNLESIGMD